MSRTFAYARVSTIEQTPENQIREIEAEGFGVEPHRIVTENVSESMAITQREGFAKLIDRIERGDVLAVTRLDRLGRDAIDVSTGRRDQYIDDYFGREYDPAMLAGIGYDPDRPATEVMTHAFQILFHRLPGKEPVDLDDLVRDDPEMLDLALGLLFHYDPA